jgi:hypothetical protein
MLVSGYWILIGCYPYFIQHQASSISLLNSTNTQFLYIPSLITVCSNSDILVYRNETVVSIRCFLDFSQFFIDQILKSFKGPAPQLFAVDKDSRGAIDLRLGSVPKIPLDLGPYLGTIPLLFEFGLIKPQPQGNIFYFPVINAVILRKQPVVKFPEFSLGIGRQGRHGGFGSIFVTTQRKVLKDKFHFFRIVLEHLLKYRHEPCAVLSLKVAENSDHHRRLRRPFKR